MGVGVGLGVVFDCRTSACWHTDVFDVGVIISVVISSSTSCATSGPTTTLNLMQLFQQQYRIFGSFGATMTNIAESLDKMAGGMKPVIDAEVPIENVGAALTRMESRQVFGKIVITF